jgi:Lon protease-like protein
MSTAATPSLLPLFPLPNVVLFPRAILPLHIFEPRYKLMTSDVVTSHRHLAMALLKPGWEKDYYGKPAIAPVVCVGEIVSVEQLGDGNYNFLLQGKLRARIAREIPHNPYRLADLDPLEETGHLEIDLEPRRKSLLKLFTHTPLSALPLAKQFRELLGTPINTPDIADLAAFNLLDDIHTKQQLLEDADVPHRLDRLIQELTRLSSTFNSALRGYPSDPSSN